MTLSLTINSVVKPQPLFRHIQQVMQERIADGFWSPGQALPSRVQLCEEFGTTRVTLDKAIQELVRDGVLRSAKGSGTFVAQNGGHALAKSSALRTLRLGVMMGQASPDEMLKPSLSDNIYFGPLFQGIRDAVAGQPVEIVYGRSSQSEYETFCRDNALDGVLLITPLLSELPALHALAAARIPFVAAGMSSHLPADAALPVVDTDNQQGTTEAIRYLLELGHRRIAIVNLATSQANYHDRLEGYRCTLAAAGTPVDLRDLLLYPIYEADGFEPRIEAWLSQFLASGSLPTAIFACDYFMAISTIRVLRRHGLRVPEDVSVVAFDDPFSAAHLTPALTTVRQPVYQIGLRSARRLLDALRSGELPRGAEVLPNQLIVRESACPLAAPVSSFLAPASTLAKEGILP